MQPILIMIETFIQIHSDIFFWLHSFSSGSENFKFLLYIIAEEIDIYIVFFSVLFVAIHQHKHSGNKPELLSRESLREGIFITVSVLSAWAISYIMKITFMMPRPFIRFSSEVLPLFPYGGFNSFPSGHATLFAALAAALYIYHKKIGILFGCIAILIALARVIAGVHFPIDILVGCILGAGTIFLAHYFFSRSEKHD